jgi:hypothetical protein
VVLSFVHQRLGYCRRITVYVHGDGWITLVGTTTPMLRTTACLANGVVTVREYHLIRIALKGMGVATITLALNEILSSLKLRVVPLPAFLVVLPHFLWTQSERVCHVDRITIREPIGVEPPR